MTPGEALRLILQPDVSPAITPEELLQLDVLATVVSVEYAVAVGFNLRATATAGLKDLESDGSKLKNSQEHDHWVAKAAEWEAKAVAAAGAADSGIGSVGTVRV